MTIALVVLSVSVFVALVAAVITLSPGGDRTAIPMSSSAEVKMETAIRERPALQEWIRGHLDRRSAGTLLLASLLLVLFAVAALVGSLLRMVNSRAGLADLDSSVARWGAEHASGAALTTAKAITQLGSTSVTVLALLIAAAVAMRRGARATVFAFVAVIAVGELMLTNGLKVLVRRDRPEILQMMHASGFSFPSGHSASAAAAWSAVALLLSRNHSRRVRMTCNAAAALVATSVAATRALLGVHWFTDVMAGLALGWGWYLLVSIGFGGPRQRLGEPVERAVPELSEPATAAAAKDGRR